MRNKTRIIILVLIAFSLSKCYFPVEKDIPGFEKKPVVSCLFNNDEPFNVHVGLTAGILDTLLPNVEDAYVTIWSNDEMLYELNHYEGGWYTNPLALPENGVLYTLKVDVDGFERVFATDSIPLEHSKVQWTRIIENARFDENGCVDDGLEIQINDISGNQFYEFFSQSYSCRIKDSGDTLCSGYFWNLYSESPMIESYGYNVALFSDETFDEKQLTTLFYISDLSDYERSNYFEYNLLLFQGSENYFKFRRGYKKHSNSQYVDFWDPMEPVIMYSNVENGYGIFAGYYKEKQTVLSSVNIDNQELE